MLNDFVVGFAQGAGVNEAMARTMIVGMVLGAVHTILEAYWTVQVVFPLVWNVWQMVLHNHTPVA